jgi:hypothetical protein
MPDLSDYIVLQLCSSSPQDDSFLEPEEVVEVRGSSACFEYQFPASPQFFVGRRDALGHVSTFVDDVLGKRTSCRGLLFEAQSGWGKSSLVLACVDQLSRNGHLAVAIDSRSASTSQFVLRLADTIRRRFLDSYPSAAIESTITGHEGVVRTFIDIGKILEQNGRLLLVFLDQFENVFFQTDILRPIRDLLFRLCDAQTNVAIGFSWKTDFIGLPFEFPHQLHSSISEMSKHVVLNTFADSETDELLNKLEEELRSPLRKDLKFLLSEFSQGYPWLLKKLCAHVRMQRDSGVVQAQMAYSLLNVKELFQEDLKGLPIEAEDALRRISRLAPVSVSDIGDEFSPDILQDLVHRRLVVRIANKYDVYWDIFRDYLNTGNLPIQDNYILRTQIGSVLKSAKLLAQQTKGRETSDFQKTANLSEKSFYNVARDMRLLGIASVTVGKIKLAIPFSGDIGLFEDVLRPQLRDKLGKNRLIRRILEKMETVDTVSLEDVAETLAQSCPYISATKQTWKTYARIFADWMDFADLGIYDNTSKVISRYSPGKEVRRRKTRGTRSRGGIKMPRIQYTPVETVANSISDAFLGSTMVNWGGIKTSTRNKAIATLVDYGFISEKPKTILLLPKMMSYAKQPHKRAQLLSEAFQELEAFAKFKGIMENHSAEGCTIPQLARELIEELGVGWKAGTAEVNVKIMLDWARHTGVAPAKFACLRKASKEKKKV